MSDLQTRALDLLHTIVGNGHRAQTHAPMTATGKAKYYTVHQPLTDDQIAAHLTGSATYAVPLIGTDELAGAGLIEQDTGGLDMARRILTAAEAHGVTMFAIVCKGSDGHDGCHAWALYAGRYDPKAIRAQLQQIAEDAGASTNEIHPNKTNIRLPWGLHLRSQTRGRTLLQSGELFENEAELEDAEGAVQTLPLNAAPPAAPIQTKPTRALVVQESPGERAVLDLKGRQGGRIDTRAIGEAVKARFKAEHTLEALLTGYNATPTSSKDWTCPFCQHSHTNTLFIFEGRLYSRSPNCIIPQKKGLDAFGLYVLVEHNDSYLAAIEPLARAYGLWVEPRKRQRREDPPLVEPPEYLTVKATKQRERDRERKNAAWANEATQRRAAVAQTAGSDDRLTPCDRVTIREMLGWAAEHNAVSCWLGRASLARLTGYSLGSVKRSVMHLEALGYFVSEGAGGRPIDTARRNFSRGSLFATRTILEPKDDPRIDLDSRSLENQEDLVRGAPSSPACENVYAPELDTWEAYDPEACGWDLDLEQDETVTPNYVLQPSPPAIVSIGNPDARGMQLVRWSDGSATWQRAAAGQSNSVLDGVCGAGPEAPVLTNLSKHEPYEPKSGEAFAGATYTPIELPDAPYTGKSKRLMGNGERYKFIWATMRPRPDAPQPAGTVNLLAGDPAADDPLVRCAPHASYYQKPTPKKA